MSDKSPFGRSYSLANFSQLSITKASLSCEYALTPRSFLQDLVRFGKFNDAITDRPKTEAYLQVFPIHANTLAVNQNLTQNPGYSK